MLSTPKPLILVALLSALAPLSAAQTLGAAQADAAALAAKAAAAKTAKLTCTPLPRALRCVVDGESRVVAIAGDAYRAFYPDASDKVELLPPGITPDHDVYFEFARSAFDALVKGRAEQVDGNLVERIERSQPTSTPASCRIADKADSADYYGLTGEFDAATKALTTSRAPGVSPLIDASKGVSVDDRCGSLAAPARYSLNYFVTPQHYWGEDILQLPQSVLGLGCAPFQANLHTCQYDGEWHHSEDTALLCTLSR